MRLSGNFTFEELSHTDTGLPNSPNEAEKEKLRRLAADLLQPIRDHWGVLKVTSAYRCAAVNAAVGGAATSQHVKGEAADIIAHDASLDDVFEWIVRESGLRFGQCIRETAGNRDWIHISLPRLDGKNQEALVFDGKSYRAYRGEP